MSTHGNIDRGSSFLELVCSGSKVSDLKRRSKFVKSHWGDALHLTEVADYIEMGDISIGQVETDT